MYLDSGVGVGVGVVVVAGVKDEEEKGYDWSYASGEDNFISLLRPQTTVNYYT